VLPVGQTNAVHFEDFEDRKGIKNQMNMFMKMNPSSDPIREIFINHLPPRFVIRRKIKGKQEHIQVVESLTSRARTPSAKDTGYTQKNYLHINAECKQQHEIITQ